MNCFSDMLKILHVTDAYAAGVQVYIDNLARMQTRAGNKVHLFALNRHDVVFQNLQTLPEAHVKILGTSNILNLLKLTRLVSQHCEEFDFIHLHSSRMGTLGRLLAIFHPKSVFLYTPHGYSFLRQDIKKLSRFFFKSIERILGYVPNATVLCVGFKEFDEAKKLKSKKLSILRALIDVPTEMLKSSSTTENSLIKFGFLCRNTHAKDPNYFLEIAYRFRESAEFIWIGANREEFQHDQRANKVTFLGQLDHDEALIELNKCNALLVTSLWEGLPLNVIEAQLMGLPVVIRDTISIPELVIHERSCFVFHSVTEIEEIIEQIKFNNNHTNQMISFAKVLALNYFSSTLNQKKWIVEYEMAKKRNN